MRKRERGISLIEVIAIILLAGVIGSLVFGIGISQYMKRVAINTSQEIGSIEGAISIATQECKNGNYSGTVSVPYFSGTISVNYTCTDISSNLVRIEVSYGDHTYTSYFFKN